MAENKDKEKASQPKNIPKDGQVIVAIMKEMGITEYDPKCIVQLTEFVYKYATNILEEARMYANNNSNKKRHLDVDDVSLALQLTTESSFTTPPPREVILECANAKNYTPLPLIKPHCGLRLPPDRYCLAACNYALKSTRKKTPNYGIAGSAGIPGLKLTPKPNVNYIKRSPINVAKQTVNIGKPLTKITNLSTAQKTTLKPKIQITGSTHNVHSVTTAGPSTSSNGGTPMEIEHSLKRKREEDDSPL